jgi:hypothetical protein
MTPERSAKVSPKHVSILAKREDGESLVSRVSTRWNFPWWKGADTSIWRLSHTNVRTFGCAQLSASGSVSALGEVAKFKLQDLWN